MAVKSRVALTACDSYDEEKVYAAVKRGCELTGGIASMIKPGEKIVASNTGNILNSEPAEAAKK